MARGAGARGQTDKGGLLVWVCWAGWRGCAHGRWGGLGGLDRAGGADEGGGKERSGSASGSRARWTIARVVRTDSSARQAPPSVAHISPLRREPANGARGATREAHARARARARSGMDASPIAIARAARSDRGARDRRRAPLQTDAARPWLKRSASDFSRTDGDRRRARAGRARDTHRRARARRRGGRQPRTW